MLNARDRLLRLRHKRAELLRVLNEQRAVWASAEHRAGGMRRLELAAGALRPPMSARDFWLEFTSNAVEAIHLQHDILQAAKDAGVPIDEGDLQDVQARWVSACQVREASRPSTGQHVVDVAVLSVLLAQADAAAVDALLVVLDCEGPLP